MQLLPLEETKELKLAESPVRRKASSHDGQPKSAVANFLQVPGSSEFAQMDNLSTA